MTVPERYPYVGGDTSSGPGGQLPYLPLILKSSVRNADSAALLDTGSAINVLPYDVGRQLGFDWADAAPSIRLTGNLASFEARAIRLEGIVGQFPPVRLAFAWTKAEGVPIILGQVNFFLEFDVCFFRTRSFIEVKPRSVA